MALAVSPFRINLVSIGLACNTDSKDWYCRAACEELLMDHNGSMVLAPARAAQHNLHRQYNPVPSLRQLAPDDAIK